MYAVGSIDGGNGNDAVTGDAGADQLSGGPGNDTAHADAIDPLSNVEALVP